ncbi:hypothetical protein BpHYR1_034695 [Brachionus plicatilis]|uniref:Uncharacterized protein n=1 Tax=Brachionus plicatilis TaxID=10195 RepID=A0A3M7SHE3_BRAPC|nr:hypothetical protein BpHYR1_034695 [Brachionus plicatilis]
MKKFFSTYCEMLDLGKESDSIFVERMNTQSTQTIQKKHFFIEKVFFICINSLRIFIELIDYIVEIAKNTYVEH